MRHSSFFVRSATAISIATLSALSSAASIVPTYDSASSQQKYWTASLKQQMNAICDLISGYISDDITISMKVVVSETMDARTFGTGLADTTGAYDNTATKYRAKNGLITLNSKNFDQVKLEWTANNSSLILHEIIHCLGFSGQQKNTRGVLFGGIAAYNANVDLTNFTFKGENTKKVNGGVAYPLNGEDDLSHFKLAATLPEVGFVKDKVGIVPRMAAGGGELLSIVDLAVLADLGYDIPAVKEATGAIPLRFNIDCTFATKYRTPQTTATSYLSGFGGNDQLRGDSKEVVALFGNGGVDFLTTGSEKTVMYGDNPQEFDSGKDNADLYRITSRKPHLIMQFGRMDSIHLVGLGITQRDIVAMKVENLPFSTPEEVKFINDNAPTTNQGPLTNPSWYSARRVTIGTLVFYVYMKTGPQSMTNSALKVQLQGRIQIV